MDSYRVGSVSWSGKYFGNGSYKAEAFKQAGKVDPEGPKQGELGI